MSMTYFDALTYLGEARRFGMKLGLEPMRELAGKLGDPHETLRFIHLAGTNGKGSTAAFGESCLRAAGRRVGLYTSPHLVSVRERIQIDRQPISEADFAAGMELVKQALDGASCTFFEITTSLALWYFAREKVDWVVWETGLGGRLDATNIVRPEVCIITNIGLDHQQYLGPSLAEIAAEKAGIIKPGVPVISAVEDGEAAEVIAAAARAAKSRLIRVPAEFAALDLGLHRGRQRARIAGHDYNLGLIGSHQVANAACAVAAVEIVEPVEAAALARGLAGTVWSGRFEVISDRPLMVLDGAHNTNGVCCLMETWGAFLGSRGAEAKGRTHVVFASVADKDITERARLLTPVAAQVSLVRLANERSSDPADMAPHFAGVPCNCYESVAAWLRALDHTSGWPILVTGSLFLVGEVLAQRQGNTGEYRLNERLENVTVNR